MVFAPHGIEVINLSDNRLKVDLGFVNEFVPVEMLDGRDVLLAHFLELQLQVTFDLTNTTGFEVGEVVGDNPRTQGGDWIREKSSGVGRGYYRMFWHD